MCEGCWYEYGLPKIDTPAVRAAADTIRAVYNAPGGLAGGNLHIVIDDYNVEDEHLEFCAARHAEHVGTDDPALVDAEARCIDALRPLTEEERVSAIALCDGYWE